VATTAVMLNEGLMLVTISWSLGFVVLHFGVPGCHFDRANG
jgi:hypothetical protein